MDVRALETIGTDLVVQGNNQLDRISPPSSRVYRDVRLSNSVVTSVVWPQVACVQRLLAIEANTNLLFSLVHLASLTAIGSYLSIINNA